MHTKKQMSRKKKLNRYPIGRGLLSLMIMIQMILPIYYRAYGQARQGLFGIEQKPFRFFHIP